MKSNPLSLPRLSALALATLLSLPVAAGPQPAKATAVHGAVQVQQNGKNTVVTTRNGAGTAHSVIDWRDFSVKKGSTTHFLQPSADSTSINRVTGKASTKIDGTLSSNGRLVLVNPAGIAVAKDGFVDTAGFTASTLAIDDADAVAGRLRFAGDGKKRVDIDGHVLARSGDVVLLGNEVRVDKKGLVQAPAGAVVLAAGQRIEITGRGLEGIYMQLVARKDRVVHLGRLEADAVGIFTSELQHSGAIQATRVTRIEDKLYLRGEQPPYNGQPGGQPGTGGGEPGAGDGQGPGTGNGNGNGNGNGQGQGPGNGGGPGSGNGNGQAPGNGSGNGNGNAGGSGNGGTGADPGPGQADGGLGGGVDGGIGGGAGAGEGPVAGGGNAGGGTTGTPGGGQAGSGGNAGSGGGSGSNGSNGGNGNGGNAGNGNTGTSGSGGTAGNGNNTGNGNSATPARTRAAATSTMLLLAADYRGPATTPAQSMDPERTTSGAAGRDKRAKSEVPGAGELCAP